MFGPRAIGFVASGTSPRFRLIALEHVNLLIREEGGN